MASENEIYVLIHSWQYDSGDVGENVSVFENLQSARLEKEKLVAIAKEFYQNRFGKDYYTMDNSDMSTSIYEKDEYCYNHDDITIYQRNIQ